MTPKVAALGLEDILENVKHFIEGTMKLWNGNEGSLGNCEILEKGNLEILGKSKTADEENCEMLMN